MNDSIITQASRQIPGTAQKSVKTVKSVEKSQPTQAQTQARKLVTLYRQIKDTGEVPEQYTDLGALTGDMDELISQYRLDGLPGLEEAFTALTETNRAIMHAAAALDMPTAEPDQDTPEQDQDPRFTLSRTGKRILNLATIDDIYALPDAAYLIARILEEATISLLYGKSGTGKTFTALDLSLRIAHGLLWHGRRVKQGPVWYINTEGGRGLKKRIQAWYKEHDSLERSPNFKIIPWSLDLKEHYQDLVDTIEDQDIKPVLIVVDNFSLCAPSVNQKNQEEVAPVLGSLSRLAQDQGCHVMIIHHTTKEDDFNGSMAFRNHVDTMIELVKEDKADKNSAILFTCQKTRDDEPFSNIKTELKQVELYIHPETLEAVTSCVVVTSEAPIKREGLKDIPQNILDLLGSDRLSYTDWKKQCIEALHISKPTFDRYRDELVEKGYVYKHRLEGERFDLYQKSQTHVESEVSNA